MSKPKTTQLARDQVRASEEKKLKAGGKRMPGIIMPPEIVEALERLRARGYGKSVAACIFRALAEADLQDRRG